MVLIHVIGESYGDPTVKSWYMGHTGVEKRDKVIGERREENTFTIAVTVSPGISSFFYFPSRAPCEGLPFLSHSCSLRRRKLQHVITRLLRRAHPIIHTRPISISATCQCVQRGAAPLGKRRRKCAIQTLGVPHQDQRALVPQFGSRPRYRSFRGAGTTAATNFFGNG